jgi:glycosyltransferase involved in cell wall biosynthesis
MVNKLKVIYDISFIGMYGQCGVYRLIDGTLKKLAARQDIELILFNNQATNKEQLISYINKNQNLQKCLFIHHISLIYRFIRIGRKIAQRLINAYETSPHFIKPLYYMFSKTASLGVRCLVLLKKVWNNITKWPALPDADVFYSPLYAVDEYIRKHKHLKIFIQLYDTMPYTFLPYRELLYKHYGWFVALLENIKYDDTFFSISHSSKKDFLKLLPQIKPHQIIVTHLAAGDSFYPSLKIKEMKRVRAKYGIPPNFKYFLSLCSFEPRRNITFTVENYLTFIKKHKLKDVCLVLAGSTNEKVWNTLDEIFKRLKAYQNYMDKIIITGYIDDEDLALIYSGALAFVFMSLYEGFGLPPLEAMKCGVPVITSNTSSMPEIIRNAGIMVAPTDHKALVKAYEKLYFNEQLRKDVALRGLQRSTQFSWDKMVNIMVKYFSESRS